MDRVQRPLSPHLQIYRWRITMWLSSAHRISGLLLTVGAFVLGGWLIALAGGVESYAAVQPFFASVPFKVLAAGWALAFFYHLFNGVRHLAWDAGYGYGRGQIRVSGWLVIIATVLAAGTFIFTVIV